MNGFYCSGKSKDSVVFLSEKWDISYENQFYLQNKQT